MRPSDKTRWLQTLIVLLLVTPVVCRASTAEKRWETADLIVEGRIIGTTNTEETMVSILTVDRVLKTDTIALTADYSKGLASLELQVPASTIEEGKTHIIFLKETETGYNIIYAETTEKESPVLLDPGASGLIILALITLSITKIGE